MMILWIDPLSICLVCVAFCDLISIYVVLVLFMLTASRSLFLYMLTWMIKLILGLVNFLTSTSERDLEFKTSVSQVASIIIWNMLCYLLIWDYVPPFPP
jgi:hypothetical protein